MTSAPCRVSVTIPVFNGERYLAQAVDSVRRQDGASVEVIIVDDGSTDGSGAVARALAGAAVRYVYQANGGPARARNRGLALARGDLIAFLDADDLWPPGRLRRQLRALDDAPAVDVVLGRTQLVREAAEPGGPGVRNVGPPFVLLSLTAALFRRRAFARVGTFDGALRYGEDTDWFMRARERALPILVQDDVALWYRRHGRNMTKGRTMKELGVLEVLKRSLDRRRLGGAAAALPELTHDRPSTDPPAGSPAPCDEG